MVWSYFYNWLRSVFHAKTRENILSITCGDIMLFHFLGVPPEWITFGEKMLTTLILTALGGAGGWIGKEIIIWVWKQMKTLLSMLFKRKK